MPHRFVRYHQKHVVIAAAGHRALQGVEQGLCCAGVSMCYFNYHSYPYTQCSTVSTLGKRIDNFGCFFTDKTLDNSKPRRPDP